MAVKIGYMPFLEFFRLGNNSKYYRVSGVFSALGAPRIVVDTFLESSTHVGPIIGYAISRIFQHGVIIPKTIAFQMCSLHWVHLEKWLIQFLNHLNHWVQSYDMQFPKFFRVV